MQQENDQHGMAVVERAHEPKCNNAEKRQPLEQEEEGRCQHFLSSCYERPADRALDGCCAFELVVEGEDRLVFIISCTPSDWMMAGHMPHII